MNPKLSRIVRRPARIALALAGRAGAVVLPAGEASAYSFDTARRYWRNVPRAQGGNPLDSSALAGFIDDDFLSTIDGEVEIARTKRERKLGFALAEESLQGIGRPRVLDYGSGIGFYGFDLLDKRPDARVTFADINPENLATIRRLATLRGLGDVVETTLVTVPDASNLSFNEPFDLIVSMGVLHHTPYAPAIVRHLTRFLRPGGIFQVMLYNDAYFRREQRATGRKLNATTFGARTDPRVGAMANPFSEPYDRRRAEQLFAGYELLSFDQPEPEYDMYRFCKPR